ncbi:MAG TPA: hypothetical protein VNR39_10715 [Pseudolabrys sp.]|nr:hypothetical protein [Pseudolabrys sp.]
MNWLGIWPICSGAVRIMLSVLGFGSALTGGGSAPGDLGSFGGAAVDGVAGGFMTEGRVSGSGGPAGARIPGSSNEDLAGLIWPGC